MAYTAKNLDRYLNGEQIIQLHLEGKRFMVGRSGGINGEAFLGDLETGGWKNFRYQVKYGLTAPNRNWFSSQDFLKRVEHEHMLQELDNKTAPLNINPWDFSHLGKKYFVTVSIKLGYNGSLDAPIETIYLGKTGEEYSSRTNRAVNPNWTVVMKDGREFKCGSSTGFAVEEGSWDRNNCNEYSWKEIKDYFSRIL